MRSDFSLDTNTTIEEHSKSTVRCTIYLDLRVPDYSNNVVLETGEVVVVFVFTLKTVLTSIQYPSLFYSSRQRNEFSWSQANPK